MGWTARFEGLGGVFGELSLIPVIIAGRFRAGIAKIVRGKVADQLKASPSFQDHRYPLAKRVMLLMAARPVTTALCVALLYGSAVLLGYFGPGLEFSLSNDKEAGVRDFWDVNAAILGVQAALVSLAFPLVIAFVGLLNQGRASFASRITIYIEASGALFVGISSLLLCLIVAVQLPLAGRLTESVGALVTSLNLLWLAVNVSALAYFILRTIAFIHPARRTPLLYAYVANIVWPRELTAIVTRNRWDGATTYGYLPAGHEEGDIFTPGYAARVWYGRMTRVGEPRLSKFLEGKRQLADVRVAMIAPVIKNWLNEVRPLGAEAQHDFIVEVAPGESYEGEQVLIRSTTPLGRVSRLALRLAFSFRRVRVDHGAVQETARLLRDMLADLIALIDSRQSGEFAIQLAEIAELHLFFYQLGQCHDEDFNYALLGAGSGLFGFSQNLGPSWVHAYRDVIERAVERLDDDTHFVGRIAHLPAGLYQRAAKTVTPKALLPLVEMGGTLAYRLMSWETNARLAGLRMAERPLPTRNDSYGEAWREFVAGWERLLHAISLRHHDREKGDLEWADFLRFSDNVVAHLRLTTEMSARAIWLGDLTATTWTCDLLLHWGAQADRAWDTRGEYWRLKQEAFTLSLLEKPWDAISPLGLAPDGTLPTAPLMFGATMQNVWRDHLVTLALLALHWSAHGGDGEAGRLAARMLLQNSPHDRGDTGFGETVPLSGASVLTSILRIRGDGTRWEERSYAGRFDHMLEELGRFGEAPGVSMRIYSSGGGLSFEALPLACVLALIATSPKPQGIDGELRRLLTQGDDVSLRRKKDYLEALRDAGEALPATTLPLMMDICDLEGAGFNDRRDHARKLVTDALAILDGHRLQAIADAEIDQDRIDEVTAAAAAEAFTRDHFPLNLFAEIEPTTDELTLKTYHTLGLSKGSYTNPLMGQTVSNETDWWRETIGRQIAAELWLDVLRKAKFHDLEGRTAGQFWRTIKKAAKRIVDAEQTPILVTANSVFPEWLNDWRWTYPGSETKKPKDLVISSRADQVESYLFHMNDIPVYEAQTLFGVAYVLPAELLQRVRYHDYENGVPVDMTFTPDQNDPWTGSMETRFQRDVELADFEIYRIRFADEISPHNPP